MRNPFHPAFLLFATFAILATAPVPLSASGSVPQEPDRSRQRPPSGSLESYVVDVRTPEDELSVKPGLVYRVRTKFNFVTYLEFPEKAECVLQGNDVRYRVEPVPVRVSPTNPQEAERDDRTILVQPLKSENPDRPVVESNLIVRFRYGKVLNIWLVNDEQHVYRAVFRDPEIEQQREIERLRGGSLAASASAQPANKASAEAELARIHERLRRIALGYEAPDAVGSVRTGDLDCRLSASVDGRYVLLALAVERRKGKDPVALTSPAWDVEGSSVLPVHEPRTFPPVLIGPSALAAAVMPWPSSSPPEFASVVFGCGRNVLQIQARFPVKPASPTQPAQASPPPGPSDSDKINPPVSPASQPSVPPASVPGLTEAQIRRRRVLAVAAGIERDEGASGSPGSEGPNPTASATPAQSCPLPEDELGRLAKAVSVAAPEWTASDSVGGIRVEARAERFASGTALLVRITRLVGATSVTVGTPSFSAGGTSVRLSGRSPLFPTELKRSSETFGCIVVSESPMIRLDLKVSDHHFSLDVPVN